MAASSFVLLLSLAMVGVGEGVVARVDSMTGVVIGPGGRLVEGAEIVAASGGREGLASTLISRIRSDGRGTFVLPLAVSPSSCDHPMVWVVARGLALGSGPIDQPRRMADEPTRIVLDQTLGASFVVADCEGRPIRAAKVIPRSIAREVSEIPRAIAELATVETDPSGRAVLTGFRPEELTSVAIEANGFGIQVRDFRTPEGLADPGVKSVRLQATGRVSGRVVAEDPKSLGGLKVVVESAPGGGFAETSTDPAGRFEVQAIASGALTVRVRPKDGSIDLPARVVRRTLEAGGSLEVEIPLRRGVRVSGLAVDAQDHRPIPGVTVSVVPSGPLEPIRVVTDEQGRYETFVPAGLVSHRVLRVPSPFLCPPSFVGPRPVEVPPAIARFELPMISLQRGVELRGSVIDSKNRPVPGARVEATWTMIDGRARSPKTKATTSKADGSFVLEPVPGDSELSLTASIGEASTPRPIQARTSAVQPVELRVVETSTQKAQGVVRLADGHPIPRASVRIWELNPTSGGSIGTARRLRFGETDTLTTDEQGRFETPQPLRTDREYRAFAWLDTARSGQARSSGSIPSGPITFPEIVLAGASRPGSIEGRIEDRDGTPLAGVSVWASTDGSCRLTTTTDVDGRFQIREIPEGRLFLFGEKLGFRFSGQTIESGQRVIDWKLARLDEPVSITMKTLTIPWAGIGLAQRILTPYAEKVLTEGDQSTRIRTLELLARVNPVRVLKLIDDRIVADVWLADHLRHAASCSPATEALAGRKKIVESIRDAEWRVVGGLDAADALPETSKALKREWIERALDDARKITEPSRRVVGLSRVADRLLDLGQTERATQILEEVRPLAESLTGGTSGGRARVEFAESLARINPAGALALTEDLVDPGAFDRCRVEIARRLASHDPAQTARILESLRDPRSMAQAIPSLCQALARTDPAQARRLLDRIRSDEPCLGPYALGLMALAIADRDKPTASTWLREAFERLGQVAAGSSGKEERRDPAAVAAALLPVAERIDSSLVPELFWRSVSLHGSRSGSSIRSDAVLALMLARYDRSVARTFLDPLVDRALASSETDLVPLITALALLNPLQAVRLIERLPEPADLTFHQAKNEARLTLAAALLRTTPACWDDATLRFLNLNSKTAPDGH